MTRYKGKIHAYNVCNEIFWSDAVGGQSKYLRKCCYTDVIGLDWPRYAFEAAREADPEAILILNEFDVDRNSNGLGSQKRAAVLNLIDDFLRRGVPIDAVGVQGHCFEVWWAATFDSAAWAQFLRDIADRGLRVYITEFDVPDGGPNNPDVNRLISVANDFLSVALDSPAVDAIIAWGLNKTATWQTAELRKLFTDYAGKPRVLPPLPNFGGTWNPSTNTPTFADGGLVNGQRVQSGTVQRHADSGRRDLRLGSTGDDRRVRAERPERHLLAGCGEQRHQARHRYGTARWQVHAVGAL
jgi:hypothetical protein